jgi:LmbE family N-acetylglucosaminyl deacetylase
MYRKFLKKTKNKIQNITRSLFYGLSQYKSPREWIIKPKDRLLVLAPHPDDESIGCGGVLLKYGPQCDVILLTDGSHGDPAVEPSMTAAIRWREFEEVMRRLQVNHYMRLNIEDGHLIENFNIFKDISIKEYDYIVMPGPQDNHIDHLAVNRMFHQLCSMKKIADKKTVYYEIWSAFACPTHYIDISDAVERKREIINVYRSQVKHIDYASRILALNHYRGMLHNIDYAECFVIE